MSGDLEALRVALLDMQREVRASDRAVMVLLAGLSGSGKGDVLKQLNAWLDVRYLVTHAFHYPTRAERMRPPMWRYWMSTPARGELRFYVDAWYEETVNARLKKHATRRAFGRRLARIRAFESALAADGVIVVKLWLDLSAATQARRFAAWQADSDERWRVTPADLTALERYPRLAELWAEARAATDQEAAPWEHLPEADDAVQARRAARSVLGRVQSAFAAGVSEGVPVVSRVRTGSAPGARIDAPAPVLERETYKTALHQAQGAFGAAVRRMYGERRAAVFVFEGWDAAGKGGAIRRLVAAVDPRQYRVVPVGAPDATEVSHHYLWRFWRHVPRAGHLTIYDRSWYGRVLVERVEGLARDEEWQRAFAEIVDFEHQLADHGITLLKFWLEISDAEQLARFEARERTPHKRHKITREDYRNRKRRAEYEIAVAEMLAQTDTRAAPWTVIAAEDKRHARVAVIEAATRAIAAGRTGT